jgi:hypothetical protein
MILVQDKPNVTPPNSQWPYGQIRDRDGVIPGTPGSLEVYGDMHQFFDKLIRESTITPNGSLDDEYNGYQLWDAFVEHVKTLRNYTRYFASWDQFSTAGITVAAENLSDIGSPNSSIRVSTGRFEVYWPGTPFNTTQGKTTVTFGSGKFTATKGFISADIGGSNQINIRTYNASGAASDDVMDETPIEIKIYD